jgi:hypothetical protein
VQSAAFSLLLVIPISLSWPLAAPVAFGMITLSFLQRDHLQQLRQWRAHTWVLALLILSGIASVGAFGYQMLIQHLYFPLALSEVLNRPGGIFGVSYTFVLLALLGTGAFLSWLSAKGRQPNFRYVLPAILTPVLLLSFGIYFYQSFSTDTVNYFFLKILALGVLLLGAFTCAALAQLLQLLQRQLQNPFYLCICGLTLVMGIIVLTGQSLSNVSTLVQSKAKIDVRTADAISHQLPTHIGGNSGYVVVFRQMRPEEDVMGTYVAYNANHHNHECIQDILIWLSADKRKNVAPTISKCATVPTTVIVSKGTYNEVARQHNPNIRLVLVP